jgi:predicted metal-dependent hydrolase
MTQIPDWAVEITMDVMSKYSHKNPPKIVWKRRTHRTSSGTQYSYSKKIVIRAGTDELDQKLVLLHELAHHICPKKAMHNMRFWRTAWILYIEYGIPEDYAFEREKNYKKKSVLAYNQMKGGE